jgi:ribosomal-protein-alanine N-acetyltransferase
MDKKKLFSTITLLKDNVVSLHSIEAKDGEQLHKIYSNKEIFKYCGIINKENKDTVIKMIPHFKRDFIKQRNIKWGIFIQENDLLIGIIEIMNIDVKINGLKIGYFVHQNYWNNGYTKRAVKLLLRYLYNEIEVNRIEADVMPGNEYSKKVLMSTGFIKEGTIRQGSLWPGKGIVDLEKYSILKQEYEKLPIE